MVLVTITDPLQTASNGLKTPVIASLFGKGGALHADATEELVGELVDKELAGQLQTQLAANGAVADVTIIKNPPASPEEGTSLATVGIFALMVGALIGATVYHFAKG